MFKHFSILCGIIATSSSLFVCPNSTTYWHWNDQATIAWTDTTAINVGVEMIVDGDWSENAPNVTHPFMAHTVDPGTQNFTWTIPFSLTERWREPVRTVLRLDDGSSVKSDNFTVIGGAFTYPTVVTVGDQVNVSVETNAAEWYLSIYRVSYCSDCASINRTLSNNNQTDVTWIPDVMGTYRYSLNHLTTPTDPGWVRTWLSTIIAVSQPFTVLPATTTTTTKPINIDSCICYDTEPGCAYNSLVGNYTACGSNITRWQADGNDCFCNIGCSADNCCSDYDTVCLWPNNPDACIDYYCTSTPTETMMICSNEYPFTQYASICHALCYNKNLTSIDDLGKCPSTMTTSTSTSTTTSTSTITESSTTATTTRTSSVINTSGNNSPSSGLEWWVWLTIIAGCGTCICSAALMVYCASNKSHVVRVSPEATPHRLITSYENAAYEQSVTVSPPTLHHNPMYESADGIRIINNAIYGSNMHSPYCVNTSDEDE